MKRSGGRKQHYRPFLDRDLRDLVDLAIEPGRQHAVISNLLRQALLALLVGTKLRARVGDGQLLAVRHRDGTYQLDVEAPDGEVIFADHLGPRGVLFSTAANPGGEREWKAIGDDDSPLRPNNLNYRNGRTTPLVSDARIAIANGEESFSAVIGPIFHVSSQTIASFPKWSNSMIKVMKAGAFTLLLCVFGAMGAPN